MKRLSASVVACLVGSTIACAHIGSSAGPSSSAAGRNSSGNARDAFIARAQVWQATQIATMDLRTGPGGSGAFAPGATVSCRYKPAKLNGRSPKFLCELGPDDDVKVKYGGTNGEVFGEVAATRLLWALGFGADRMYPVRVICRGCPREFGGIDRSSGELIVNPAVIERKMAGREIGDNEGWSWKELDRVNDEAGGANRAERDALKLLAVLIQHTDSKPSQQRLLCRDRDAKRHPDECDAPFMMVNDLGLTFGRANLFNGNSKSGMNFADWSRTPVWKDNGPGAGSCVGNLPRSNTGSLDNPVIGEAGRRFLAGLLTQLTDAQLHDLFEVSRAGLRPRSPGEPGSTAASVDEWVNAFKDKREQIVARRCST